MQKNQVLFLCTGNSARSQMAEGILRHLAGDRFEVHSAGLEPKGVNPLAITAMREIGIDISGHASKSVQGYIGATGFTHVITVCDHAAEHCPILHLKEAQTLHWSFEDPAAAEGSDQEKLAKFRHIRDQIKTQIESWIGEKAR